MSRTLAVAAVQPAAHDRTSFAGAWPGITREVRAAAERGAQLIVLPEATLPAYVLGHAAYDESEIASAIAECALLARELCVVIVAGAARRRGDRVYNSAVVFDQDGSIAGEADKHFLWHFDRHWFAPGERIEPVRTSIGTIGALVCADGRIPTIARTLVDRGAEILVMPTAWVTSGRDPQQFENVQADLLARVRARENRTPFVAANKCGVELHCVAYCGKSQIVAADGTVTAIAPEDRPQTIASAVELGGPRPQRAAIAALQPPQETSGNAVRIAISATPSPDGIDELLEMLDAELLVAPDADFDAISRRIPAVFVSDEAVLDPGALVAYRRAGYTVAIWETQISAPWQVTFARARALELRMYAIVVDRSQDRAYAVDPDGSIVCGTFGDYEIAGFTFDPSRAAQTAVAPGTDVSEGLERAAAHAT